MRIALVSPPWYAVPPAGYGGIERVVALLAGGLVERGHEVVLFAREGSRAGSRVIEAAPQAWETQMGAWVHKLTYLQRVHSRLPQLALDVVHDHTGGEGILMAAQLRGPAAAATVHEPVGHPEATFFEAVDGDVALVAVSEAQAASAPGVDWAAIVANGVDLAGLRFAARGEGYLLHVGRADPSKGQHLAIDVARRAGRRIVLAGKVDRDVPESRLYFEREIEPRLGPDACWVGEVGGDARARLIAGADAMLFPLQWEEPFGLAVAESQCSGAPVVTLARGAMRELVDDGVTGCLVESAEEMPRALRRAVRLDRARCAAVARERYNPSLMVERYERLYTALAG